MVGLNTKANLDREWIELIKSAKQLGLTIDEIKTFLTQGAGLDKKQTNV